MLAFFWGEIIHHSLFYYLKDDGNRMYFNDNKTYSYAA
ncbi:hypothetical protein AD01_4107 [Escherichia coli 2-427-07_S4_C2]|uniref:Uncharacterized protein n=1 Tax=Escherichia coli O25b:H4 TaxID=941280 RepID=A0A192CK43_ECO25|nr:hypothetical protein WLH_04826 [Escherichia coli O25b:H4]KDY42002.1 hypothetical protein AD01_4107 [Escherichia coli 2-427-07_S4_C2]KEO41422.1 hypothetical protein AB34_0850 [Escherichia coli 2-460-02_S1_C2]